MTQAKVAAELGVAQNTISDWFRGKTRKNVGPDITAPPPDARVKVNPKHKPELAKVAKERQKASGKVHGRGKVVANLPQAIDAGKARDQAGRIVGYSDH